MKRENSVLKLYDTKSLMVRELLCPLMRAKYGLNKRRKNGKAKRSIGRTASVR